MSFKSLLKSIPLFFCLANAAHADCTVIFDTKTDRPILREGDCAIRHSPASTFKIPLALMGYDSGILKDEHAPLLPYKKEYNAFMESWRHDTDPTYWEKESVIWYSQELTKKLGMKKFKSYVDLLNYGDKDLSGKNALTHAWLDTTLHISPDEQITFLKKFLKREYSLSEHAYDMTYAIIPTFPVENGWTVHGKTGSTSSAGWFIGWANKGDHTIVFARHAFNNVDDKGPAGPRLRAAMLKELPNYLP